MLAIGSGPFGDHRRDRHGAFNFDAGVLKPHTLYLEDCPKRVRAKFNGETIVDSRHVKMLHETSNHPAYYFPESDVRMDLLEDSDHTVNDDAKGDARYWSLRVGDKRADNAVLSYSKPGPDSPLPPGLVTIVWDAMDGWYEEDEQVYANPHDPYHRVDVLNSSRHVTVSIHGETVADTHRPLMLFESSLPERYYIPEQDVRMDLLTPTDTHTDCPYKGVANYYSARIGDRLAEDVAFCYPEPRPEAVKLPGTICFLGEAVETRVGD
ncbi:MAG TPA: DUF427 domain-containing protein [Gammaproteobacteria bacterium]|nr:DUF427 domain-containing protein [Gammaproteobacteria bacterium]